MGFAGVSRVEQEVVIRLDRRDQQAHIWSTWPDWSRKLAKRYGPPAKVTKSSRGGKVASAFWTIPLSLVIFRRSTRQASLTEAQREVVRERLRNARFSRVRPAI
jgi:hypothetical protein